MTDENDTPTDDVEISTQRDDVHVEAQLVVGTGTPPTSPNFGAPRYSGADPADFPPQANAITDAFDAQAAKRGAIVNADIAAGAAISKTKLVLDIVDADVDVAAAIQETKLALATDAAANVGSRRTLGPGAQQAAPGNDSRLRAIVGTAIPVLDVGVLGQIRAGRQLTAADFAALGLTAPRGLWNLSDLTDASGNGRTLTNKGAVPFGPGINGVASTCAVFAGSTAQALYISDTGAADPFRITTGSFGGWFRTAKTGAAQDVIGKWRSPQLAWELQIASFNSVVVYVSLSGSDYYQATAVSAVCDDRWHFAVGTFDGTAIRCYVDGVLEGVTFVSGSIFGGSSPLNIGAEAADGSTAAASMNYGRVDEAFVTADVLSDDQVRALYCAKIAHGLASAPAAVNLAVRRARKGAALATTDFPAAPLRLHNFTGGSLNDQGSNAVALTNNGGLLSVVGADGAQGGAYNFNATYSNSLSSTDAGLPAGATARSYGLWLKTSVASGSMYAFNYGQNPGTGDVRLVVNSGQITCANGSDSFTGPFIADGQWHYIVAVEDNAAGDGVKRKLYLDGRLVGGSTVLNALTLGGANKLRLGCANDNTTFYTGQLDGVFVCGYALTQDQISTLYAKGSQQLAPSVKNAGDHIESMDAANIYCVFDTLDTQHTIDLAVTG